MNSQVSVENILKYFFLGREYCCGGGRSQAAEEI
jgi:hypothetical protein